MEPGKHFVITLIKGEDELPRDYVSRCNAIAAFARERSSTETMIEIPGYPPLKEQPSERDTHFANWAASVWDELHTLSSRKIDEANQERYEAMDKEILARAGYDLVRYAINAIKSHIYTNTFTPDTQDEIFKSIPDMTAQPEQEEVHTEE